MRKHIMDRILEHPDADGCFLQSGGPIMTFRLVHAETGVIVYPLNPNYCDQWATLDEIELWLNEPRSQGEKIPIIRCFIDDPKVSRKVARLISEGLGDYPHVLIIDGKRKA